MQVSVDDDVISRAVLFRFQCRDGIAATKMLMLGADPWRFVHGVARRCCALQVRWLWWQTRRWRLPRLVIVEEEKN